MKLLNGALVALAVCGMASTCALGCNTFRGAGKDIQRGGEAIENAAESTRTNNAKRETRRETILASAAQGGSISPTGSTSASYGSSRTFSVTPHTGFHVADVLVDGKSIGAVNRHTFENINTGHTISALFTADPAR